MTKHKALSCAAGMTLTVGLALAGNAHAAETKRADFGKLADGQAVEAITLSNHKGVSATVITYGASLQALITPDRNGKPADITLGYADLATYVSNPQYFGATVGRFANRINKGQYKIDGKTYQAPVNNGVNRCVAAFGSALLRPGETYSNTLTYRFSVQ